MVSGDEGSDSSKLMKIHLILYLVFSGELHILLYLVFVFKIILSIVLL